MKEAEKAPGAQVTDIAELLKRSLDEAKKTLAQQEAQQLLARSLDRHHRHLARGERREQQLRHVVVAEAAHDDLRRGIQVV